MYSVIHEFLTTDVSAPNSYGDEGCILSSLRSSALVLRHEHFTDKLGHTIYLFARVPELGAQVFIYLFPMPDGESEYQECLKFYLEQKKSFRIRGGRRFLSSSLIPNLVKGFKSHTVFRTRDGIYRRRIVHCFAGTLRSVVVVYSSDTADHLQSAFFKYVSEHLSLADTEIRWVS